MPSTHRALFRSTFKASVSLFIPMVVFFFHMTNGRTKYDEWFGSVVVDTYSLKRPIYTTTTGGGGAVAGGNSFNQAAGGRQEANRPQFNVG